MFDISCTTADGRTLIIEMQKAYQPNFKNRTISYVSSRITSQSRIQRDICHLGHGATWKYNLNPVYIIAILNFSFTHDEGFPQDKYVSSYHIREDETNELFNKTLNFTFIEMGRFLKKERECATMLDKLTYSLKHMHTLNTLPSFFDETFFNDLYKLSELNNFTAEEIKNYMESLFAASDYANTIDYAREEGEARGITKRNVQIATAMLADGVNVETICKYTGLTPEEVNALK